MGDGEGRTRRWDLEVPWWLEAVLIAAASRVFAIVVLTLAAAIAIRSPSGGPPWASPFVIWDAEWYLHIAATGYHPEAQLQLAYGPGYHDFAFFPAWPILIRLTSLGGSFSPEVVAPLLANLLFVLAAIPIALLFTSAGGRSAGRWGLLLFSFSPVGYVYSLAYSEPLFLVAVAGAFVMRDLPSRWKARTVLAFVTQFTRVTGIAFAVALIPYAIERSRRLSALGPMFAVIVAFAAWWAFIAILTGSPLGYLLGTPSWYGNGPSPAGQPAGLASLLGGPVSLKVLVVAFVGVVAAGTVRLYRDGDLGLALFSTFCVVTVLIEFWSSMPRLAGVAFPAFLGLAVQLPTRTSRVVLLASFAVAQVGFAYGAVAGFITP